MIKKQKDTSTDIEVFNEQLTKKLGETAIKMEKSVSVLDTKFEGSKFIIENNLKKLSTDLKSTQSSLKEQVSLQQQYDTLSKNRIDQLLLDITQVQADVTTL